MALKKLFGNRDALRAMISIATFLVLWESMTNVRLLGVHVQWAEVIPPPSAVISTWIALLVDPDYWKSWYLSFFRVAAGFMSAMAIGIPLGLAMAISRTFHGISFPVFEILRPIPPLAWVPAAIIFWPTQEMSIVFVIFLGAFTTIVINVLGGARAIDVRYAQAAQAMGSSSRDIFRRIILPGTIPSIAVGGEVGMGITWAIVVAAEMIAGGGSSLSGRGAGLGYFIWNAYVSQSFPEIIVGMFSIGAGGYAASAVLRRIGRRLTPWTHPEARLPRKSLARPPVPGASRFSAVAAETAAPIGEIRVDHVSKAYGAGDAAKRVVRDCSFTIERNKLTVMIGPSGCGKSTLIRLLAGFEMPDRGTITLDGAGITGPARDRLVLFQETALFPWMSTYDNVMYGPRARGQDTPEMRKLTEFLLEKVGLTAFRETYPPQLSGGMQRRAELARAMINDPAVMILDEPFRGLDAMTKELMWEYYAALYEGSRRTNFFVTTDIDEAIFLADRLLVMTNAPTSVRAVLNVDIPRPRRLADVFANESANRIKMEALSMLHEEAMKSFSRGSKAAADFIHAYAARVKSGER